MPLSLHTVLGSDCMRLCSRARFCSLLHMYMYTYTRKRFVSQATTTTALDGLAEPKKEWERVKYSKDFLMQFMEVRCSDTICLSHAQPPRSAWPYPSPEQLPCV